MRFYQSLDYVNNIHSLTSFGGDSNNGNISSSSSGNHSDNNNINTSTVKTFTSNGNHQALTKSIDTEFLSQAHDQAVNINFLSNYRNDSAHHNSVTIKALSEAIASTTTGEPDAIIDGNLSFGKGEHFSRNSNGNAIDECGDSSDLETNINHMITRGNLYKLNFDAAETELDLIERNLSGSIECLASSPDDSFMDDDGMVSSLRKCVSAQLISFHLRIFQTTIDRHRRPH